MTWKFITFKIFMCLFPFKAFHILGAIIFQSKDYYSRVLPNQNTVDQHFYLPRFRNNIFINIIEHHIRFFIGQTVLQIYTKPTVTFKLTFNSFSVMLVLSFIPPKPCACTKVQIYLQISTSQIQLLLQLVIFSDYDSTFNLQRKHLRAWVYISGNKKKCIAFNNQDDYTGA